MALLSKLFKGDVQLEACLIRDAAHVIPGAAGDHVAKIQAAVAVLDGLAIDTADIDGKRYGASTAAAVLAYKKTRKIINPAYQTQADNIVGKMTIATLDREMVAHEQAPRQVASVRCVWPEPRKVG